MFVASVIPACPLPCANADEKAIRMANEKKILFLVIVNCFNLGAGNGSLPHRLMNNFKNGFLVGGSDPFVITYAR